VHTPFDTEKKFGEDLRAAIESFKEARRERLAEIAERFVEACRAAANGAGIDLVALTDHNSVDGYWYLKPYFEDLAKQARESGLLMPVILPGVEFSVGGERPIHFLVVFAADTDPEVIDRAIHHVFGPNDRFDPKTGTPRATGQSVTDFLTKLYEFCRPPSGDRNLEFVVLPAHADDDRGVIRETTGPDSEPSVAPTLWNEMKGNLRERVVTRRDWHGFQTKRPYDRLPQAFKELLLRWTAARRGENWDQLTEEQKARYREQKYWPLVECSDPHSYETIGSRYTWLKMEVPDLEGIRLALLDPESRLRRMADGPPDQRYPRIERIRIRHTDFLDEVEIPLSPWLTTLIGGRGTGKSTVVEYLRHALDRAREEDFSGAVSEEMRKVRSEVLEILKDKDERDFGQTKGTLLPNFELEADIVVSERRYRVRRTHAGIEIVQNPGEPSEQKVAFDVRSLIAPHVFSQGQIASIAKDPASQRTELDALVGREQLAGNEQDRRATIEQMQQLQSERSRLREQHKTLPARETELQKVNDQIAFLEQEGRKDVIGQFRAFEDELRWLDTALEELTNQANLLDEQAARVERVAASLPQVPTQTPSSAWLHQVSARIREQLNKTSQAFGTQAVALRQLAEAIRTERADKWQPDYDRIRQEYEGLREELQEQGIDFSHHERLLQQRADLEREVANLRLIAQKLDRVEREIREVRSKLIRLHEERVALRREQARVLEELDSDIRIEIIPFGDRADFESRRDEWFAGAGLQERDWILLVDYVFAIGGEVPDRIAALVKALRTDIEATEQRGRTLEAADSAVVKLLGSDAGLRLTGHFFRALERRDRIRLDELERFLPEDAVEAHVRGHEGDFKPIITGSVGQRSTAILSLLLSAGKEPLIIDQPEADLDNQYIYDVVVNLLRRRKFSRQIIVATHNANIPVNGDAELIVALGVENRMGNVLGAGSIDQPQIKDLVTTIMEGSAEAFRLRRERYGF
jgi:ABC-type enterochelin transport system ATPase subunit/predicted nuclease with TOPRIM domain